MFYAEMKLVCKRLLSFILTCYKVQNCNEVLIN